jgi:hypothetical protein
VEPGERETACIMTMPPSAPFQGQGFGFLGVGVWVDGAAVGEPATPSCT